MEAATSDVRHDGAGVVYTSGTGLLSSMTVCWCCVHSWRRRSHEGDHTLLGSEAEDTGTTGTMSMTTLPLEARLRIMVPQVPLPAIRVSSFLDLALVLFFVVRSWLSFFLRLAHTGGLHHLA